MALAIPKPIESPKDEDALYPKFDLLLCPCWPKVIQSLIPSVLQVDPALRPAMADIESILSTELDKIELNSWEQEDRKRHCISKSRRKSRTFGRQRTFEIDYDDDRQERVALHQKSIRAARI